MNLVDRYSLSYAVLAGPGHRYERGHYPTVRKNLTLTGLYLKSLTFLIQDWVKYRLPWRI